METGLSNSADGYEEEDPDIRGRKSQKAETHRGDEASQGEKPTGARAVGPITEDRLDDGGGHVIDQDDRGGHEVRKLKGFFHERQEGGKGPHKNVDREVAGDE